MLDVQRPEEEYGIDDELAEIVIRDLLVDNHRQYFRWFVELRPLALLLSSASRVISTDIDVDCNGVTMPADELPDHAVQPLCGIEEP